MGPLQSLEDAVSFLTAAGAKGALPPRPWVMDDEGTVGCLYLEDLSHTRRHKHKSPYDKWRNSGGKRGLLLRAVPPALVGGAEGVGLARRRGFVHRGGPRSTEMLKYVQFSIEVAEVAEGSEAKKPFFDKLLLYQVISKAAPAVKRAAKGPVPSGKEQPARPRPVRQQPQQRQPQPQHQHQLLHQQPGVMVQPQPQPRPQPQPAMMPPHPAVTLHPHILPPQPAAKRRRTDGPNGSIVATIDCRGLGRCGNWQPSGPTTTAQQHEHVFARVFETVGLGVKEGAPRTPPGMGLGTPSIKSEATDLLAGSSLLLGLMEGQSRPQLLQAPAPLRLALPAQPLPHPTQPNDPGLGQLARWDAAAAQLIGLRRHPDHPQDYRGAGPGPNGGRGPGKANQLAEMVEMRRVVDPGASGRAGLV